MAMSRTCSILVPTCLALAGAAFAQEQPTQDQATQNQATQNQTTPTPPQARTVEEQKTMPPPDARWAQLDADADGRISPIEADKDSAFGTTFDDMDTDEDGFVSNAEYIAFGNATATQSASQDTTAATEASATSSVTGFAGLDKDKDGRVSSTEAGADASFDTGFAAMDDNGDGFVTDAEFRAHAQATKQPPR